MPVNKVEVIGRSEFQRDLRRVSSKTPKVFQQTNKKVANRVVDKARVRYSRRYASRSGKGRASIRALASTSRAQVAIGRPNLVYVTGQNFGSNRYPQFRPKASPDHFLYATIEAERPSIHDDYLDDLMDTFAEAFPGAS